MAAALASKRLVVVADDGFHILSPDTGADLWPDAVNDISSQVSNPIIVNDPTLGATIYVVDYTGLYAPRP